MKETIYKQELGVELFDDGSVNVYRLSYIPACQPSQISIPYWGGTQQQTKSHIITLKSPIEAMDWLKENFIEGCKKSIKAKEESYQTLSNDYKSKKVRLAEIKKCL